MNELSIFSARMRLSDLISANHNLILMLPRLGISLGFGDKSVQEVCEQYHLPVDFFMLICNVYTFAQYSPSADEISQTDMSPLLPYLRSSTKCGCSLKLLFLECSSTKYPFSFNNP